MVPDDIPDLLTGMATTRAIRRIEPDAVPEEDLATILWHASRAPSGSNRQNFRFLVLRDGPKAAEAKAILGRSFRAGWGEKRTAEGYDDTGTSRAARVARAMNRFVDAFEQIPVVVLVCLVRHRAPTPTEGASVYPAAQNLLLAARALGYGGVMSTWHTFVEGDLRQALAIPDDVFLAATIPLGRPVGNHGPVRRRPLPELVHDDHWGGTAAWARDPDGTSFTRPGPPRST